jgi:GNAT superfamily N-acetyltransferase
MEATEKSINREDLIALRPGTLEDQSFIFATWLQGLRHSNDTYKLMEADAFFRQYHKVIERILTAPETTVLVACLKEAPDVIVGYSVSSGDTLHWTHVKKAWRGIGIAKSLLPAPFKVVTHVNRLGVGYLRSHPNLEFNPFLIP